MAGNGIDRYILRGLAQGATCSDLAQKLVDRREKEVSKEIRLRPCARVDKDVLVGIDEAISDLNNSYSGHGVYWAYAELAGSLLMVVFGICWLARRACKF